METVNWEKIEVAKKAALEVLMHNSHGPYNDLPRTAGWGYPEPYTRDLMFSVLGIAVSNNKKLLASIRRVLKTLAQNQTKHGHIPSLVHDNGNRGASDTTPLFLLGVGIYRKVTGNPDFLQEAVKKAMIWMEYQCPLDLYLVAQQPTSDWRDEQWVLGYGLYVNTIVYSYLRLLGQNERADMMFTEIRNFTNSGTSEPDPLREGFMLKQKPYFAFWSYKIYSSDRFDLLGNSIAVLSGLVSVSEAEKMILWVEDECEVMKKRGELAVNLPPNFFPFIKPEDSDWRLRYEIYNKPGEYHNGGIWPFICGFYVAALVAAKKYKLAEKKLIELTQMMKISKDKSLEFGFNEWFKAQDGKAMGNDWQTWSAALYIYAAKCVEKRSTPFFDEMRT
ncbi:MAG: amylo-alpha-1,6-glucosidase [Flavobacteriaceae bacterium]|nr:amylo-alpha-1,6-glucosidase [Flavobacteriaceae bacterium]